MKEFTDRDLEKWPQTIFRKVLKGMRKPKALVVGPSDHPLSDPSVPALEQIISSLGGEFFIVDLQSWKRGITIHGVLGNLDAYEKNWAALKHFGIALGKDQNFVLSDAAELPFKDGTFDFVLQRNTFPFFIHGGDPKEIIKQRLNAAFRESLRVLRKGGVLLVIAMDKPIQRWLNRKMRGMDVEKLNIVDRYMLELSRGIRIGMDGLYRGKKLWQTFGTWVSIGDKEYILMNPISSAFDDTNETGISEVGNLYFLEFKEKLFLCKKPLVADSVCYVIKKG